jgi:glucose/arabinose dehydrogenase
MAVLPILRRIGTNESHRGLPMFRFIDSALGYAKAALLLLCLGAISPGLHAQLSLTPVGSGLVRPLVATHAADSSGRLFVAQRAGVISIMQNDSVLVTPYLDIRTLVTSDPATEGGLLGMAFHPSYASNGHVFVLYTNSSAQSIIARYTVMPGNPNQADPASAQIVMTIGQGAGNHYGGALAFGPQDGYLYISVGDADTPSNGQNLTTWRGKILRINVNTLPYQVPADNPFAASPSPQREIWAYGMRNPWRISFEQTSGDLFVADVGGALEEISQIPRTQAGANLGWTTCIGSSMVSGGGACTLPSHLAPIITYDHNQSDCAIIGGFVYRGTITQLQGAYIFADHCTGRVFASYRSGPNTWGAKQVLFDESYTIGSIGEDQAGEIYICPFVAGTPLYRIAGPQSASAIFSNSFE